MNDSGTMWLTITNLALGAVVLICVALVGIGVVQELADRRRRRIQDQALDREVQNLVASYRGHELIGESRVGATLADGGEPLLPPDSKKQ